MKPSLSLLALPLAALLLTGMDGPREHRDSRHHDREVVAPRFESPRDLRGRDQDAAYTAMRSGAVLPLREIEGRVMPRMPGASYLGPEFDSGSSTYRLKFMTRGSVTWVDVDGRTGAIIGRSGN